MSRRILILLVYLPLSWASNVSAQPYEKPAQADKMVRVTYPIADLVVPIHHHTVFGDSLPRNEEREISRETVAEALMKRITESVARETRDKAGGKGTIQYFPIGAAFVVNQRADVHREIIRLLADLRRQADVQVSMEVRCVYQVSPPTARQLRAVMDAVGEPARAWNIEKPRHVGRFVSLDEKQLQGLLELAQTDRAAHILQAPKLTVYNGQQAGVNSLLDGAGVRFDVWPVVAADQNSVRFSLHLEHGSAKGGKNARTAVTEAIGTFAVPTGRSLVWQVSDSLFVVATPRVILLREEEPVFLGNIAPIPGR